MEIILLEKVHKLGNLGDKVKVRRGYGRNFLVPYGKAVRATDKALADFEQRRAEFEAAAAKALAEAETRSKSLADLVVTIAARASEGKLYGSLTERDIARAISDAGVAVKKQEVHLADGAIRAVGQYDIPLHLHVDVTAAVKVVVVEEK
ncbi:MAG: ribosomal protein [Gammaproteobacteria bacterium]|jgi:large subunit ribosomal protein L9|nr:ribosomal protein [Gammaproteobacteria bacterium]